MRLELIPLVIAVVVGLLGLGLIIDAWTPDEILIRRERRRATRTERSRGGEAILGFGVLGLAAAFGGRDSWAYSVIAVIVASVFLLVGTWANRSFLSEAIGNRGPMRRRKVPPKE